MTFILTCMENSAHDLQLSNIDWRSVASEIVRAGLVDEERGQTLAYHLCTEVTSAEADAICEHLTTLMNANARPFDVDKRTAKKVAKFVASSFGFEVC